MGSQLFTTPSPVSLVPSPRSEDVPRRSPTNALYRISQYYDGETVRIQESRRRLHVTAESKQPTARDFILFDTKSNQSADKALESSNEISYPSRNLESISTQLDPLGVKHVTCLKPDSPRVKAQAVIIHAPTPTSTKTPGILLLTKTSTMPTPPATPKLGRLSTPDLSDLEDIAFCDCCVKEPLVKYCVSCGCSLYKYPA